MDPGLESMVYILRLYLTQIYSSVVFLLLHLCALQFSEHFLKGLCMN